MSIRYSYNDFTTKGHGVIEYADPRYYEDGKKPKRRSRNRSKYAVRWPSPNPMKVKSLSSKQAVSKSLEKQAQDIFKQRYPGQQPQKGQIKEIIKVLRKSSGSSRKQMKQKAKAGTHAKAKNKMSDPKEAIDERTLAVFKLRFPGRNPQAGQLNEIKQEVTNARKKLGL